MTTLTDHQAKLFALELLRRHPVGDSARIGSALMDAQVDLNPHQVDAALFAFRSPFSKGVILADEVGLGKTIEAGLVLTQRWAEGRRRVLVIVPASLRKQWVQELADKFFLPAVILETKTFNAASRRATRTPLICRQTNLRSSSAPTSSPREEPTSWRQSVGPGDPRRSSPAAQRLQARRANRDRDQDRAEQHAEAAADGDAAPELADGAVRPCQHHRRAPFRRRQELSHPVFAARRRRPLRRPERPPGACLPPHPAPTGCGVRQLHEPRSDHAGVLAVGGRAEALRHGVRLPAAARALRSASGQRTLMVLVMRKLLASSTFAIAGALDSLAGSCKAAPTDDDAAEQSSPSGSTKP